MGISNLLQKILIKNASTDDKDTKRLVITILGISLLLDTALIIADINTWLMAIFGVFLLLTLILAFCNILMPAKLFVPFAGLVMFGFLIFRNNGLRDTAMWGLPLVLIVSSLMIGKWGAVIYGCLSLVLIAILGWAETNGYEVNPFSMYNSTADYFAVGVGIVMIAILQWLVVSLLNQNITKARESEKKFRSFIESSSEGFVLIDEKGTIIEWNQAQENISGFGRQDVIGKPLWTVQWQMMIPERRSLVHPEHIKTVVLEALQSGHGSFLGQALEIEIYKPGWQRKYCEQITFPIKTSQGYRLGSIARDISLRKREETERNAMKSLAEAFTASLTLKELARILATHCRRLFDHDSFRLDLYDERTKVRTPVYAEDTPIDGTEPVDIDTTDEAQKPVIIQSVFEANKVLVNRKEDLPISDGLTAWGFTGRRSQSMMFIPLRWQGHCTGVVYIHSYSPGKYDEQDINLAQLIVDQCGPAVARVTVEADRETLYDELEKRNAELERFTYTVSHDLKSPLITIRGFLGYLEEDIRSGNTNRLKADIRRIGDAADKMQRLLNELLELSRIGRLMNPPQEVSFEDLVHEAVELVHGQISDGGVKVVIAPDLPVVYGDRARLTEVMQNLLDNAVKFMGNQPQPRVEVGSDGLDETGKPILFVRDNGIGIPPQYQNRVFGLFDKLDPHSPGTGIGLALVKRIVEVHEGRIWVDSEGDGKGSTFYFTIKPKPKSIHSEE